MKSTWTVARRELRSFFDHPTAYILAIAFLGVGLFLAFRSLYAIGAATLRPFFGLVPWLFAIFIPAVTMRSLAEERRGHTLEWLVSQPLGETQVILGKFLGNWLFVLIVLAGTLPMAAGVLLASEADPGIVVAQYIGAGLLAAFLVAVGLWASAMTRNQITAFILAAVVSFALVLLGLPVVQFGLPPAIAGAAANLSVLTHFEGVARGVIDLRDVLYFLSGTALFLLFAGALVARDRLSPGRGDWRRLRAGAAVAAAFVIVLNLLGGYMHGRIDLTAENLYTLSSGTDEVLGGVDDLVTIKLFVSDDLPAEVQLTLRDVRDLLSDFERAGDDQIRVAEIDPEDSDAAREQASALGIGPIEFNVLREDEFEVRQGWLGLAVLYADEHRVIPLAGGTRDLEYQMAAAVSAMTRVSEPVLAFATGFGAKDAFQLPTLRDGLDERYAVETVSLSGDTLPPASPDSFDVVAVVAPTSPLDSAATAWVDAYLDAGGAALFLLEHARINPGNPSAVPVHTGLENVLAERGLRLAAGIVYDLRANERVSVGQQGIFNVVRPYPLWPVVFPAGEHPVTRGLNAMTLAWASPVEVLDSTRVDPLWRTTEAAGVRPPSGPVLPQLMGTLASGPEALAVRYVAAAAGPGVGAAGGMEGADVAAQPAGEEEVPVDVGVSSAEAAPPDRSAEPSDAAAADSAAGGAADPQAAADADAQAARDADPQAAGAAAEPGGRLVLVGDANFLDEQFVRGNPQNLIFALNAVDWLAQEDALMRIRSKDRTPPPLVFESELGRGLLKWGSLIGVPLLFVLFGLWRITGRERRARRRWEGVPA